MTGSNRTNYTLQLNIKIVHYNFVPNQNNLTFKFV